MLQSSSAAAAAVERTLRRCLRQLTVWVRYQFRLPIVPTASPVDRFVGRSRAVWGVVAHELAHHVHMIWHPFAGWSLRSVRLRICSRFMF